MIQNMGWQMIEWQMKHNHINDAGFSFRISLALAVKQGRDKAKEIEVKGIEKISYKKHGFKYMQI